MKYKIISDGCCDLNKEIIEQYQLDVIPFYISFDEEHYDKEIEEIGIREVSREDGQRTKCLSENLPSFCAELY